MIARWRRLFAASHRCAPPTGVVFDPSWRCLSCGVVWLLVERANVSVWIKRGAL